MSTEIITSEAQLSVAVHCPNCEAPLAGHYCAHCGQANHPLDPRLHDLAHELMHEFLHLDGKILSTLKSLIFYPGRLSAELLAGKRARSIGPVRLYLTMSVLFFLLLAHDSKSSQIKTDENVAPQISLQLDDADADQTVKNANRAATAPQARHAFWKQKIEERVRKIYAHPDEFGHELQVNCSHAMFVLVPLFALLLQLAYRNRSHHYPAYIYFSLHYHAFVFLLFSLSMLVGLLKISLLDALLGWIIFLGVPVYLYLAMRRVFGGSAKRTLLRLTMLSATYSFCLVVAITVVFAVTVIYL